MPPECHSADGGKEEASDAFITPGDLISNQVVNYYIASMQHQQAKQKTTWCLKLST